MLFASDEVGKNIDPLVKFKGEMNGNKLQIPVQCKAAGVVQGGEIGVARGENKGIFFILNTAVFFPGIADGEKEAVDRQGVKFSPCHRISALGKVVYFQLHTVGGAEYTFPVDNSHLYAPFGFCVAEKIS